MRPRIEVRVGGRRAEDSRPDAARIGRRGRLEIHGLLDHAPEPGHELRLVTGGLARLGDRPRQLAERLPRKRLAVDDEGPGEAAYRSSM